DVRSAVQESMVLATGDVKVEARIQNSLVLTTGSVSGGPSDIRDSTILASGTVSKPVTGDSVVKEKQANPLAFLRLFQVAQLGLEVKDSQSGVVVEAGVE